MPVLRYRDPATGVWQPLPGLAGPTGAAGPTGPAGPNSGPVFTTDVEVADAGEGLILKSPDGSRFRVTVGDDGALTTTEI